MTTLELGRTDSAQTFSIRSGRSFQSNQCQFCMSKTTIMEQLALLKKAVILKNQRITQLENFIKKISRMAFLSSMPQAESFQKLKINPSQQIHKTYKSYGSENQESKFISSQSSQCNAPAILYNPIDISFRNSKQNTLKLEEKLLKLNEDQHQIQNDVGSNSSNIRQVLYKKSFELNREEKNLDSFQDTASLGQHHNKINEDTLKTLSQPQQEGDIGSIKHIPDSEPGEFRVIQIQNSKKEFVYNNSPKKNPISLNRSKISKKFAHSSPTAYKLEQQNLQSPKSKQKNNSLSIIKQYLKNMK